MQHTGEKVAGSASSLALCLQSLATAGHAVVSAPPPDTEDADALPLLEQLDAGARAELGLPLPLFSAPAALWGARLFYQLCRFVVCRDIGESELNAACDRPSPEPRGPETDWSVDLTLHHLPRLFQLARQLSNADPLLKHMSQIAHDWPLSSVGIAGLEPLRLESFVDDSALRRLYADRVLAAGDTSRLGHPRIDDLLRADLGLHHELAPLLAAKLFEITNDTH